MDKNSLSYSVDVSAALKNGIPVLALESTIISHGMPYPDNLHFARKAEGLARNMGVTPATIAIVDGHVHIGLEEPELLRLAHDPLVEKVAARDIAFALAEGITGATTVSATMRLASLAGIDVFATGGFGGVHRGAEASMDISEDLHELSRTTMIVVSAGAKAILDIPLTLEYLETFGVPVVGFKTNEFPAFYSRGSGSKLQHQADSPAAIADIFQVHKKYGGKSALLVTNPVPKTDALPVDYINEIIDRALAECCLSNILGKKVTPFLLSKIVQLTEGRSLPANISLALNNVRLATEIAVSLSAIK
ncbi:MAG: pseudouridine-5'-phosphate glycosidase [Candidatus Neomarinimicrobiota bacterium]